MMVSTHKNTRETGSSRAGGIVRVMSPKSRVSVVRNVQMCGPIVLKPVNRSDDVQLGLRGDYLAGRRRSGPTNERAANFVE